jgi:hypothetical protein
MHVYIVTYKQENKEPTQILFANRIDAWDDVKSVILNDKTFADVKHVANVAYLEICKVFEGELNEIKYAEALDTWNNLPYNFSTVWHNEHVFISLKKKKLIGFSENEVKVAKQESVCEQCKGTGVLDFVLYTRKCGCKLGG